MQSVSSDEITHHRPLKIALTGYSGLVGAQIEACAGNRGHSVMRIGRKNSDVKWSLGDQLGPNDLRGVDMVVHCAHDFNARSNDEAFRVNVLGSMRLLEDAEASQVGKFVFISSMAAETGNQSVYGKHKRETESLLAGRATILRPGVVWDDYGGGLVGAIDRLEQKVPILPVPKIERRNVVTVHNRDLAEVVLGCQHEIGSKVVPVAHPETMSLPQLTSRIKASNGNKCKLIYVSPSLARRALSVFENLGTSFGFRSDSLTSLMTNPAPGRLEPDPMGVTLRPFPKGQGT